MTGGVCRERCHCRDGQLRSAGRGRQPLQPVHSDVSEAERGEQHEYK